MKTTSKAKDASSKIQSGGLPLTTQPKFNRAIAVFILLNFSFAQVLPSGLAMEQVFTPQQETQTPTTTLEESMDKEETTDSENPPPSDYDTFLSEGALSVPETQEIVDQTTPEVPEADTEIIDINGKKVSVDMKALVDQIKSAQHEAANQHSAETGQYPIEGYGMESLLFLKGVEELFTKEEVMEFLSVPSACLDGSAPCLYSSAPSQYTDQDWNDFTAELLRRMDAKEQEILAPINYLVAPGPDAPTHSVLNIKVIELVKNGLEDPNAQKWEEVKAAMVEISAQIEKLKELRKRLGAIASKSIEMEQEYRRLNEILNGKPLWLADQENVIMPVEIYAGDWILIQFLESIQARLQEAVSIRDLEKASVALEDYKARKSPDYPYVPLFDEVVAELSKMIDIASKRLEELPGLIEDLKIKITERSRMWEEQAMAALKGFEAVANVELAGAGSGYWIDGEVWPFNYAYPQVMDYYMIRPFPYFQTWVEPSFFKVTLKDGTELKIESRNGEIDPEAIETLRNIYPSVIDLNGKKVSVEMKALIDGIHKASMEASSDIVCVGGWACATKILLLQLPGVKELFSEEELGKFETRAEYPGGTFTQKGWIDFTTELLRRMDAKGQNILEGSITNVHQDGSDETGAISAQVIWSVKIEKVIELVKNGLEDSNAKKWDTVRNALSEINSQLEKLNALKNEMNLLNQKTDALQRSYNELNQILAGERSLLLMGAPEMMVYWPHLALIQELEGYQASLKAALEEENLDKALSVVSAYEVMKNNVDDLIPSFEDAVSEISRLMAEARERLTQLPGLIQALKDKIAARSKEWEERAMSALKAFDVVSNIQMLVPGDGYWVNGKDPWPNLLHDYFLGIPQVYWGFNFTWVEPRFFKVILKDGVELKIESRNGLLDPAMIETLRNYVIYPGVIEINGKKVSVEMEGLISDIQKEWDAIKNTADVLDEDVMSSLLVLKGIGDIFTKEDLLRFNRDVPYCPPGAACAAWRGGEWPFSVKGWIDFTAELLRRMDAKEQEILAPINYLVDPGPDAVMFSVMNEKVIELVKNGVSDPNVKKWEEIQASFDEITAELARLYRLKNELDWAKQRVRQAELAYQEVEQIWAGERYLGGTIAPPAPIESPHEKLIKSLEEYQAKFKAAISLKDILEASRVTFDYENWKNNLTDDVPSFDEVVDLMISQTEADISRALELTNRIADRKKEIAARSQEWEEQAKASFKGYDDIIKNIVMSSEKKNGWEGVTTAGPAVDGFPTLYVTSSTHQRWMERRFFTITFSDGSILQGAAINGELTQETIAKMEEKKKQLSQPKPSEPPLVKSLPPSPAAVGFFAPVFRAPLAKVFGGVMKAAAKFFKAPLIAVRK